MGEAATGNLYRFQNPIRVCKLQRPNEFKPPYMPKESRFVGGEENQQDNFRIYLQLSHKSLFSFVMPQLPNAKSDSSNFPFG